jgi:hypothetical protein
MLAQLCQLHRRKNLKRTTGGSTSELPRLSLPPLLASDEAVRVLVQSRAVRLRDVHRSHREYSSGLPITEQRPLWLPIFFTIETTTTTAHTVTTD